MSEWIILGLVAAGLYLVECIAWIRSDAIVCFRQPLRRRWRCKRGDSLPGNDRGGVVLVEPMAWLGSLVVVEPWPFSLSPDGVVDLSHDRRRGHEPLFVSFSD